MMINFCLFNFALQRYCFFLKYTRDKQKKHPKGCILWVNVRKARTYAHPRPVATLLPYGLK